jgi:hypothetical protein
MMLQDKILAELKQIPEVNLAELYDIIHHFRLRLEREQHENPTMKLAGAWVDMPAEQFQSLLEEIGTRRQQAFSRRRADETG